jgi:hypothetical protein
MRSRSIVGLVSVFLFERIPVEGGGRGRLIELIRGDWSRHVARFGIRLDRAWATVGSTGNWPEAAFLWEMGEWSDFARAQSSRYPLEERDPFGAELWHQARAFRGRGRVSLLESVGLPSAGRDAESGSVTWIEEVTAKAGALRDYQRAFAEEYLAVAEARGMRLTGSYRHAIRPNEGVHLWSLRDFAQWRELMESEETHEGVLAWHKRCTEWLVDVDGHLLVTPPDGPLRT